LLTDKPIDQDEDITPSTEMHPETAATRSPLSRRHDRRDCVFSHDRMTLTLTRWPWYSSLTYILWRRTSLAEMKFVDQSVQTL